MAPLDDFPNCCFQRSNLSINHVYMLLLGWQLADELDLGGNVEVEPLAQFIEKMLGGVRGNQLGLPCKYQAGFLRMLDG